MEELSLLNKSIEFIKKLIKQKQEVLKEAEFRRDKAVLYKRTAMENVSYYQNKKMLLLRANNEKEEPEKKKRKIN